MNGTEGARLFREAWIAGVRRHFPGEPDPAEPAEWPDLPLWHRETVADVFEALEKTA
ncbi:hypothetical protein ACFV1A_03695 [Streptomyces seoulensis]|uniref:hypothetical protein n=1 Tax=Streptomyces seoulensis TaxID=73044 RepID=UPI003684B577